MNQPSSQPAVKSSVPADVQLYLLGFDVDEPAVQQLQAVLCELILECGGEMDLRLLDGITVGANYDDALYSVDLGYASSVAKTYTNANGLLGVAKTLRVKRNGAVRAHVVFSNVLGPLLERDDEMFGPICNLVAHELAHVALIGWFDTHSPGVTLEPYKGDWATGQMQDTAHIIWEEYAACRLCAHFATDAVQSQLAQSVELALGTELRDANDAIKRYRKHADTATLFMEVGGHISRPLRSLAYLLGHLDGAQRNLNLVSLCPTFANSRFSPYVSILHEALRQAWESRLSWNGMHGVDRVVDVLLQAMRDAGVDVQLSEGLPGTRLDVPFTSETTFT